MRRAASVALLSLLAPAAWAGNTFTGNQLVKTHAGYNVSDVSHADWMFDCNCSAGFGGMSRAINPSPVNGGPTSRTANPIQAVPGHSGCAIFDSNGDGLGDFNFEFEPGSLHDIGVWTIPCSCTMVDPAYCLSCSTNACGVCCDPSAVVADPSPSTFVLTVFNSPPTASITTSPAAPAWNSTVTLHSGGHDPDHGTTGLQFHWAITTHPSATALSSETVSDPTIHFTSDHDIGHWLFSLDVDDEEGERVSTSHSFDVPNVPPTLTINPPSPITINALENIAMSATATDPDGGNPSVVWDLAATPAGSSHAPQSHYATGDTFTPIATGKRDVGDWQIHCTATDNEGASAMPSGVVTDTVLVHVDNLPPTVTITGVNQISVGDSIHLETTPDDDPYGDPLQFQWEVVQVPHSAGVALNTVLSTSATLDMPTLASDAGTWIFKLTATESGVASTATPSPVVTATYTVLVDALPTANIALSATGPVIAGDPPTISTSSFPITFDASGSIDPDSPCPSDPNHCHDTDTPPAIVSPGIVAYLWTLIDVSPELFPTYPLGRVDEVFGINGTSATLVFNASDLLPGQYTFEVEVTDGEGNSATEIKSVLILAANTAPIAQLGGPARYLVGAGGLAGDIVLSGANSFDLDNVLTGGTLGPGLGIIDYQWEITPPLGCTPPAIPSGAGAATFTLYAAGSTPPNACLGTWEVRLTVGDDDTPQLHGSANTFFIIGNCPATLCIDDPTTATPVSFDFSDQTDVTVAYHLDSTVYEDPAYSAGAFTRLDIYDDSAIMPALPFYTSYDSNPLATDKGAFLSFNWNGTGNDGSRPSPGTYSVFITIDNFGLSAGPFTASQPTSIYIAVAEVTIEPTSDRYVDQAALDAGTTALHFNYTVAGGTTIDQLHWRVRDASNTVVEEDDTPVSNSGTVLWDGKIAGVTLASGDYTFELEALRAGASLGVSAPHAFTLYQLGLKPTTAAPTPLSILVNSDDDDLNNVADLTQSPAAAGEDDLVSVDVAFDPAVPGTLVLSSSLMPAPFKVWSAADKTSEIVLPKTYNLPGDTVPATLFIEGTSSAASTLTATLTPTSTATALPAKTLPLNMIELAAMNDTNADFVPDAATLFVRVGLWDFAFRLVADAGGAVGTLFNQQDDVSLASGNPQNFIGRDSRRFYIAVRDAARNGDPANAEELPLGQFDWYTVAADGTTDDDHPPADATLSLLENGPNTASFVSAAVMLVAGQVDRNQPTNSGLAAHPGMAAYNTANHRTRQVAGPDGFVVLRYQPTVAGSSKLSVKLPLFQRAPEERRVVSAHVFNFSNSSAGIASIPAATVNQLNQLFTDRMTVMGFRTNIIFNAATDVIDLPAASPINLNMVGDFTGSFGTLAPSADQAALIGMVRAVDPATAANADTIYIMYIGNFGNRGESFPDGWIPAGSAAKNFTFTAGSAGSIATTPAHEIIAHMLCNQTLSAVEAAGTQPGWGPGGHYGSAGNAANAQDSFNLCRNGTVDTTPMAITDSLRIWDDAATHVYQQITRAHRHALLEDAMRGAPMRIVAALGLCIALVAPLQAQAQAQGGTAMDARLTAFATHDGLARAVAFDRFDKEVPAAARADALVAMWSAADARPDRDLARESILAYLVGKSVHDLPWSDALRALAKSAAVSPAAEQRRLALGAMIKRDGATEMRDPIVHALDDQSEPVRDLAIGEVARWPDHQALLSGYVKRNQSKKAHANTLERARFLIQRDGIK